MTKCLLGAGTFGCSVTQALMGRGVRTITFVDSSCVALFNAVWQPFHQFEDFLGGGELEAKHAEPPHLNDHLTAHHPPQPCYANPPNPSWPLPNLLTYLYPNKTFIRVLCWPTALRTLNFRMEEPLRSGSSCW